MTGNEEFFNGHSQDEKFMGEVKAEIEKNLSDQDFNIDTLCKKLYISRSTFFRKVREKTGKTPNEYIMSYRLKRAVQLFKNNYGNVSEVSEAVGFDTPQYFAKCFKEKFGHSPKAFQLSYLKSYAVESQIEKEEAAESRSTLTPSEFLSGPTIDVLDRELIARGTQMLAARQPILNYKEGTPQCREIFKQVMEYYDLNLAVNDALKHFGTVDLAQKIRQMINDSKMESVRKGRYALNPMDIFEIEEEQIRRNALSAAAVCMKTDLLPCGKGFSKLENRNFGETFNLSQDEPFFDQPIGAGPMCTGVLVAEDVIATAAHFVNEKNLIDICFVFGFVMQDSITPITTVPNENIYKGVEILRRVHNPEGDWVLVKLDRKVPGREIATLSNKVFYEQPIYIIGHSCGLPLKFAPGAYVENHTDSYFRSDLDIYSSNSGSPVFCAQTHEVIGIVSRSRPADLRWTGNCWISLSYPDNVLNPLGSQCSRATEFIKYVQQI
jgi:AraC-like DNA-binding protein